MTISLDTRSPAQPTWYDDLCSCLQMTIGCVLEKHGWDPVQALGSGWRFVIPQGPVEPVEYYHPAGDRLGDHFCLHHPVRLVWHRPDAVEAQGQLRTVLEQGRHVIVAVNNFHLPFRPAYHDVHAAHLILVTGLDDVRDEALVHDPMPPAFRGAIPREVLDRARESLELDDVSDPFFAGGRPSWRWIEVIPDGPQPSVSRPWMRTVMRDNLAALRRDDSGPSALAALLRRLRPMASDRLPLRDVYVLGWPAQAEASLHATFLAAASRRLRWRELAELARSVDTVAHAWTGFRVAAAHATRTTDADLDRVLILGRRLLRQWDDCLDRYQQVAEGIGE